MDEGAPLTVLCLASYEKGAEFIRACKGRGARTILLTLTALEGAAWPRDCLDETFYMPDLSDVGAVTRAVSYLARSRAIDRIVALDDYDVETAAALREHLLVPGMGATAARRVRDKLAMRARAHAGGVPVPAFVPVANDAALAAYMGRVPPPWVLKPRSEVSTIGISVVADADEVWARLDELGDRRSCHLLERYVPGDVYHVDSIVAGGAVLFAEAHTYGRPPLDVYHGGGIFLSRTLPREGDEARALRALNRRAIAALGVARGATHLEFIRDRDDGQFYFLEAGARVGGAYIADMVEAATGVSLWGEWARLETSPMAGDGGDGEDGAGGDGAGEAGEIVPTRRDYAGVIVSLARQEQPDMAAYDDPEIVCRLRKPHHAGLVVAAPDPDRVAALLDDYARRFARDFVATLPPQTGRPPVAPPTVPTGPAGTTVDQERG